LSATKINYLSEFKNKLELKPKDVILIEKEITAKAEEEYNQKIYKYKQFVFKKFLLKSHLDAQDYQFLQSIQLYSGLQDKDIAIIEQEFIKQNIIQRIYYLIFTEQKSSYILLVPIILIVILSLRGFSIPSSVQQVDKLLKQADNKLELGNYKEAVKTYSEAIKIDPKNIYAYLRRGNTRYFLKQYQAAIEDYKQVISFNPNSIDAAEAYQNLGQVHVLLDKKQAAINYYQMAANIYKTYGKKDTYKQVINIVRGIKRSQPGSI
jgi:tetratricopeptide (TPR) repeat protein